MIDYDTWKLKADADVEHVDSLIASPRSKAPGELWTELDNLIQWLARSGELLSEIEGLYESAVGAQAEELSKDKKLAPSTITSIAKGRAADIKIIFRRIERQNAALVHTIDGVRSLLSYEKENMRNVSGGAQK